MVDEYRLLVAPVVVGAGKRLFADGSTPSGFALVESEITSVGAVHLVLRPKPSTTGGITVEDGTEILQATE